MTDPTRFFSGGRFQYGADERFPHLAGVGVWYFLARARKDVPSFEGFTSTLEESRRLCAALRSINDENILLVGVWTGQYNTDLFPLNKARALERIEKAIADHEAEVLALKQEREKSKKARR